MSQTKLLLVPHELLRASQDSHSAHPHSELVLVLKDWGKTYVCLRVKVAATRAHVQRQNPRIIFSEQTHSGQGCISLDCLCSE